MQANAHILAHYTWMMQTAKTYDQWSVAYLHHIAVRMTLTNALVSVSSPACLSVEG